MGGMLVRRILFFVFLLGTWAQAAGACTEAHAAPAPAQEAMQIAVPAVSEDFAVIGGEHRCDCPAIAQNVEATVSESSKYLLASYMEGCNAFPNSSNPASVALAVHSRASGFIARRSGQLPHLLALPLRL